MSLFAELKRRNVFKVGAAYLALGWIVVQITATLTPAFHLPESALPLVTWIGAIGFPFVIVFAWAYELTPEGLKRESEVDRSQSITHVTSRKLDYIIIGMLAVAMLMFAADRFVPREASTGASRAEARPATSPSASATANVDGEVDRASARQGPAPSAAPAPDDKSIAVLPFADMSQAKDQEYFSDGISEELLNLLAQVRELRVAARTSSFAFKGKEVDIAEIAKKLNVAHVLEGSVRKSGDTVRITAQLIRAADGYHLWSQSWDRKLDDIFKVQDEIAAAVVSQLKVTLLGGAPTVKQTDARAYALYLQGHQLQTQGTAESYVQAIDYFKQAIAIDPNYGAAWFGLFSVYINQGGNGLRPIEEANALAREAVQKAQALNADDPLVEAALARIALQVDLDYAAAARHYMRALELDPVRTDVIGAAASLALYIGRVDLAVRMNEYQVVHDPVNATAHYNLAFAYQQVGRFDDALASARTSLALSPGNIAANYNVGTCQLLKGDAAGALDSFQHETAEIWRMIGLPMAYHALGRHEESDKALAQAIAEHEREMSYNIAYIYAFRGEPDKAFEWLDKAVEYKDPGVSQINSEPLFLSLHTDPRWNAFLLRIGMAPERLAAIPFYVKLPQ